jgi:hypothetical protein
MAKQNRKPKKRALKESQQSFDLAWARWQTLHLLPEDRIKPPECDLRCLKRGSWFKFSPRCHLCNGNYLIP